MTDTPERERWITPHALLGGTSASAATFTTAGLTMGAAGVVTVAAVGAGVAAGAVALRRFAPGTAERVGLRKPGRTASHTSGHGGRKPSGGARKTASRSGGLGRRGLLGKPGSRRKAGHGAGSPSRRKASHGLLGSKRRVAGRAAAGHRAAGKRRGLVGRKAGHPKSAAHKAKRGLLRSSSPRRHAAHKPAGRKHTGHRKPSSSSHKKGLFGLGKHRSAKHGTGKRTSTAGRGTGRKGTAHTSTAKRGTPTMSRKPTKGKGLLGGHPQRKAERKAARAAKRNPQTLHGSHPDGLNPQQQKKQRNRTSLRQMFRPASHDGRLEVAGGEIMPNPFAGRQEAISGSAPLEIERANDLIDYVQHAPDYYEAIANRARIEADAIVEGITIAPEFGESLKGFAESQSRQVEKVREYGEVFRRAHAERLRKLEEKDPREEKWDISKNRY